VKSRRPTHQLVGDFKNAGRAWRPQGQPEELRVHDFLIKELGRAVPYGICDLASSLIQLHVSNFGNVFVTHRSVPPVPRSRPAAAQTVGEALAELLAPAHQRRTVS
jgi:hypothetical protein